VKHTAIFLSLFSALAFGLTETDLKTEFPRLVTPMFSLGTPGTLSGVNAVELRYRAFPRKEGKGVIVLVQGYTETFLKHQELIYDLWNAGYSVYSMDHRGMGLSGRLLKNPQIVYVDDFQHYVSDLEKFLSEVVSHDPLAEKLYLIGHSLGGLVAAHLMAKHPTLVRAAVLSAPMFDLATGKYPRPVAAGLADLMTLTGNSQGYAPGYGDLDLDKYTLEVSPTTQSEPRFDLYKDLLVKRPEIRQGGPSVWWVKLLLRETSLPRVERLGSRIQAPLLMLQPTRDSYVNPKGQNRFCGAALDCRKIVLKGSKHEIYREKDVYRVPALKATLDFLDSH